MYHATGFVEIVICSIPLGRCDKADNRQRPFPESQTTGIRKTWPAVEVEVFGMRSGMCTVEKWSRAQTGVAPTHRTRRLGHSVRETPLDLKRLRSAQCHGHSDGTSAGERSIISLPIVNV